MSADVTIDIAKIQTPKGLALVSFLDPRPVAEAADRPYEDSVNIPANEIAARVAELPRKDEAIRVIGPEPYKQQALDILKGLGREPVSAPDPEFAKYGATGRIWLPNAFLEESVRCIKPGTALDLACGTGRDAVYLASLGWDVTGVDVLQDAVERAQQLAGRYLSATSLANVECRMSNVECGTETFKRPCGRYSPEASFLGKSESKLSQSRAPRQIPQSTFDIGKSTFTRLDLTKSLPAETYDLVTCFFYYNPDLLAKIHSLLNPGGVALIELFTNEDKAKHGKPKKTVNPADLPQLLNGLQITSQLESWQHGRHTVRVSASVR